MVGPVAVVMVIAAVVYVSSWESEESSAPESSLTSPSTNSDVSDKVSHDAMGASLDLSGVISRPGVGSSCMELEAVLGLSWESSEHRINNQ